MTLVKGHNNFPVTYPKEMEIYNLPDAEFNTVVLRRFSELQESTEGQSKEIRQIIHK